MKDAIVSTIVTTGVSAALLVGSGAGVVPALVISAAVAVPVALVVELVVSSF